MQAGPSGLGDHHPRHYHCHHHYYHQRTPLPTQPTPHPHHTQTHPITHTHIGYITHTHTYGAVNLLGVPEKKSGTWPTHVGAGGWGDDCVNPGGGGLAAVDRIAAPKKVPSTFAFPWGQGRMGSPSVLNSVGGGALSTDPELRLDFCVFCLFAPLRPDPMLGGLRPPCVLGPPPPWCWV